MMIVIALAKNICKLWKDTEKQNMHKSVFIIDPYDILNLWPQIISEIESVP